MARLSFAVMSCLSSVWFPTVALMLAWGCPVSEGWAQQEERGRRLIDRDYCFQLRVSSDEFQLFNESQAQQLNPDAAAAILAPGQRFLVVTPEIMPGASLEDYSELVQSSLAPVLQVESITETKLADHDAIRLQMVAQIGTTSFRFVNTVLVHDGFGYQVNTWGLASQIDQQGSQLDELLDTFSFVPGKPKTRLSGFRVQDFEQVGSRVEGGSYRSAISGVRVTPPLDWRLVVGSELHRMESEAEIGFVHDAGTAFGVLVSERLQAGGLAEQSRNGVERVRRSLTEAYGEVEVQEPVVFELNGEPTEFVVFTTSRLPEFRYLVAWVPSGELLLQFQFWHFRAIEEGAGHIESLVSQIQLQGSEEIAEFREQLLAQPNPQAIVFPFASYRDGLFHWYPLGVSWKKPPGFWHVMSEAAREEMNSDAQLIAVDRLSGRYGMLIVDDLREVGWDAAEFHETVVRQTLGDEAAGEEPETLVRGDLELSATSGMIESNGLEIRYRVATAVRKGIGLQVLSWGLAADPLCRVEALDEFSEGVAMTVVPLAPAEEDDGGVYRDYRTGYLMRWLGREWRRVDQTPVEISGMGSVMFWGRLGQFMTVIALQPDAEAPVPLGMTEINRRLLAKWGGAMVEEEPEVSQVQVAGVECQQMIWRNEQRAMAAFVIRHKQVTYILAVFDSKDEFDELIELAKSSFDFQRPHPFEAATGDGESSDGAGADDQ